MNDIGEKAHVIAKALRAVTNADEESEDNDNA